MKHVIWKDWKIEREIYIIKFSFFIFNGLKDSLKSPISFSNVKFNGYWIL